MEVMIPVHDVTIGVSEAEALRKRYHDQHFGLETGFENRILAEEQIAKFRRLYGLTEQDIRLVRHVSSPETGHRTVWEVYVRDGKGVDILFL